MGTKNAQQPTILDWALMSSALLLLCLLIAQPLVCIYHCHITHTAASHRVASDVADPHFFCELASQPEANHVFVWAFWPMLPALLPICLRCASVFRRLPIADPFGFPQLELLPPLPPPRLKLH